MRPQREMPAEPVQHGRREREQRGPCQPWQRMRGEEPDQLPRQHRLQRAAGKEPQAPILCDLDERMQRLEGEGQQRNGIRIEDRGADLDPPIRIEAGRPHPGAALEEAVAQPVLHRVGADRPRQHPAGVRGRQDMQAEGMGDHRRADQRGDDPAEAVKDRHHVSRTSACGGRSPPSARTGAATSVASQARGARARRLRAKDSLTRSD